MTYESWALKPIFHCDAKPFVLGTFALPNAKYTNMLVSFALGDAIFSRHPTQNPNASQWNIGCVGFQTQNFRVGHVHFMFFVLISFGLGCQHKCSFQWNMGLSFNKMPCVIVSWTKCGSNEMLFVLSQKVRFEHYYHSSFQECDPYAYFIIPFIPSKKEYNSKKYTVSAARYIEVIPERVEDFVTFFFVGNTKGSQY